MAFDSVHSLLVTIDDLVKSPRISVDSCTRRTILAAASHQGQRLANTILFSSEVITSSDDGTIIEEARRLEDAIRFAVSTQCLEQSKSCKPTFSLNLHHLKRDVDRFSNTGEKMTARIQELWEQKAAKMIEEDIVEICAPPKAIPKEEDVSASATEMVGLHDEFRRLRDRISQPRGGRGSRDLRSMALWITGMAGVGKTTFVERLYHDPLVRANFEYRAFVRVGREYRVQRVLRAVIAQLNRGHDKNTKENWVHRILRIITAQPTTKEGEDDDDDDDLSERLLKILSAKTCLIILDDVWDAGILENLVGKTKEIVSFESLIMLTSRVEPRSDYKLYRWKMRFLNKEESWELLKRKVFDDEKEVCPPLFVKPGKKIAKKCEGLPLLIIAVADLLRTKIEKNPESWNRVAKNPNSVLEDASLDISEVLISSYYHLSEFKKPLFLYIAAFPQSYVVGLSTINRLWCAEGFFHFDHRYTWDSYKSYAFRILLENNVVIADQEESWSSNEIKACRLHCAYWYLCKRIAKDNMFLYIMHSYTDGMDKCVKSHHRLAIQSKVLLAIEEVHDNLSSASNIRSVLCTGSYHQYQVPLCLEWKLLRVLDALTIRFYDFPVEVAQLILLRYLALTCNANLHPSISKLWSLQYLIVHQHSRIRRVGGESFEPVEIWDLQELIHLEIMGRNLPEPPHPGVALPNLAKLIDVGAESCTKGVLENIPKLKKLRIQIELVPNHAAQTLICFDHISKIENLESFQVVVMNPALLHPPSPLSISILRIEKLSLGGLGYPWEEMSKIAKLPYLYVLKLRCYAFQGEKWEANEEMKFPILQYLYVEDTDLVQWVGDKMAPRLRRLTMKNCYRLHEIPKFPSTSIMKVELIDCNPLAEACAMQHYRTTRVVTASYSWKKDKSSKGIVDI